MNKKIIAGILCGGLLMTALAGCANKSGSSSVSYDSVESVNQEAQAAYDSGNYEEALTKYAEAISTNPIDINAQLGAARCQIALENYDMAAVNLSAALSIDPKVEEIYDTYIELGKASDDLSYAQNAVKAAQVNQVDGFLAKLPPAPVLSHESGNYEEKIELTITAEPDEEIVVRERKDSKNNTYNYTSHPIPITHGDTEITVYCVRDGVPSPSVEATYSCTYDPVEVKIQDRGIEMLVRDELGLSDDSPIMDTDCEQITEIESYALSSLQQDVDDEDQIKIESLEDLSLFPNLTTFDLDDGVEGLDYSVLAGCFKLRYLSLTDCGLTSLAPIAEIQSLERLDVMNNQIDDFGPISDMKLSMLQCNAPSNGDLSFLTAYKDTMYDLSLYACGGMDLSVIGELKELEELYLSAYNNGSMESDPLGDLHFLLELPKLSWLSLAGLEDYSPVSYIKTISNLQYLYLRDINYEAMPDDLREELKEALPGCRISN